MFCANGLRDHPVEITPEDLSLNVMGIELMAQ
jgi:hypothetical protein